MTGTPKVSSTSSVLGVPVIGYRQDDFPAFWARSCGLAAPLRMDQPAQIAAAHVMRGRLGLAGGQLVGNPITEEAEIPLPAILPMIEQALSDSKDQAIAAKSVTPFLLARIFELTEGRSLKANIALVRNNARLAAEIAQEIAKLRQSASQP